MKNNIVKHSLFFIILFLVRYEPFETISLWFEKFDNKKLIWCEKFKNISNNCFDTHHTEDEDLSLELGIISDQQQWAGLETGRAEDWDGEVDKVTAEIDIERL